MSWTAPRFIPRDTHRSQFLFAASILVSLVLTVASAASSARAGRHTGLHQTIFQRYAFDGVPILDRKSTDLSLAGLDEDGSLPRSSFIARWEGQWLVDRDRVVQIVGGADDRVVVTLDDRVVLDRAASGDVDRIEPPALVTAGWHRLAVFYEQFGGGRSLSVAVKYDDEPPVPFNRDRLFPEPVADDIVRDVDSARRFEGIVQAVWAVVLVWWTAGFALPAIGKRVRRRFGHAERRHHTAKLPIMPPAVAVVGAGLLLAIGAGGPDYGPYIDWANSFVFQDLFVMRSGLASPLGLPVTQVSHGPGLVLGLGRLAVGPFVSVDTGAMAIGGLAGLAFWWAALRILRWAANGRPMLTVWAAGALFVGTHAGFYSHHHASESIGLALIAFVTLAAIEGRRDGDIRLVNLALIGAAAGLLVVTRAYLAPYAAPAVILELARLWRYRRHRSWLRTAWGLKLLLVPLAIGVAEIAFANRWMTGSPTVSPYVFGDQAFRSMDWANPELLAVLIHPWHGLLLYHPLYALGFVALVGVTVRLFRHSSMTWAKVVAVMTVATVLFHVYMQAAWYVWWMGTTTFGSRGLSALSVVLVPALTRVIAQAYDTSPARARTWLGLATMCCVWSFLMLLQGTSQFLSYGEVIAGQRGAWTAVFSDSRLMGFVFAAVPTALLIAHANRMRDREPRDRLLAAAAGLCALLAFDYLFQQFLGRSWVVINTTLLPAALILAGLMIVSACAMGIRGGQTRAGEGDPVRWGIGATFVATTFLFAVLAFRTERRLSSGDLPRGRLGATTATYQVSEVLSSYNEYRRVPGFEDKKAALGAFLKIK